MHLHIGYKRYSSWSLRPWLAMKVAGIPFSESVLPFAHDQSLKELAERLRIPATVPVLEHNGHSIWDSISILEYLADSFPEKYLWPKGPMLKALARSASAEMHSGFLALRSEHPMNCHRQVAMTPSVSVNADLERLAVIWRHFEEAEKPSGEFLCGHFSNVDAMFAPVAWRVKGYKLNVSTEFDNWSSAILALPEMTEWVEQGHLETWRVEDTENVGV